MSYSIDKTIAGGAFDAVVAKAREALAAEGFGVLCEIDVAATLRRKLGLEMGRYLILGACNPSLAHRALEAEPRIGVLLPCNVVVREAGADTVEVSAMDPEAAMQVVTNPAVKEIAATVRDKLARVVAAL